MGSLEPASERAPPGNQLAPGPVADRLVGGCCRSPASALPCLQFCEELRSRNGSFDDLLQRSGLDCCGNAGLRGSPICAILSLAELLRAAPVPSGDAGAATRGRPRCSRGSCGRCDRRKRRERCGDRCRGRGGRRGHPPRHGAQLRVLLLTRATKGRRVARRRSEKGTR